MKADAVQSQGGVLVVTDRYPPYSLGGAELSLQIALREIARTQPVTVVVLGGVLTSALEELSDGIRIVFLPLAGPWPFHGWFRADFNRVFVAPALVRAAAFTIASLRFLFSVPLSRFPGRLSAFAIWLWNGTNLPAATDLLVAREKHVSHELQALIERFRPWLIHADNHDAIMAVAGRRDVPLVGFVRDNRFLCARQDQAAAIGNQPCSCCAAACIEGAGLSARFTKGLIRQTASHRADGLASMTRVVVASRYLERQLGKIVSPGLVRRVVNPIDSRNGVKPISDLAGGRFNIAVIGSLTEKKGQVALLRFLPKMLSDIPGLQLHFLGSGPDEAELRRMIESYRASSRVTLHGHLSRDRLYDVLSSCQVVAIPSLWAEPFGRTAIEAAAMALPVVAFASGGLAELVQPGVTGFLVPVGDFSDFIAALSRLASNPELCGQFGQAARDAVLQAHAPATVAAQLLAVWHEAANAYRIAMSGEASGEAPESA